MARRHSSSHAAAQPAPTQDTPEQGAGFAAAGSGVEAGAAGVLFGLLVILLCNVTCRVLIASIAVRSRDLGLALERPG